MRQFVIGIVLATVVTGSLSYAAQQRGLWVYGAGTASCGEWSRQHLERNPTLTLDNVGIRQWMLGYISGLSVAGAATAQKTDDSAIAAWVTNYCADHPLDTLDIAGDALFAELVKR